MKRHQNMKYYHTYTIIYYTYYNNIFRHYTTKTQFRLVITIFYNSTYHHNIIHTHYTLYIDSFSAPRSIIIIVHPFPPNIATEVMHIFSLHHICHIKYVIIGNRYIDNGYLHIIYMYLRRLVTHNAMLLFSEFGSF